MYNQLKTWTLALILTVFVVGYMAGPAVQDVTAMQTADTTSHEQAAQLENITGTIVIETAGGEQAFYVDVDGDDTPDYRLESASEGANLSSLNDGQRVTLVGKSQGNSFQVKEIRRQ